MKITTKIYSAKEIFDTITTKISANRAGKVTKVVVEAKTKRNSSSSSNNRNQQQQRQQERRFAEEMSELAREIDEDLAAHNDEEQFEEVDPEEEKSKNLGA